MGPHGAGGGVQGDVFVVDDDHFSSECCWGLGSIPQDDLTSGEEVVGEDGGEFRLALWRAARIRPAWRVLIWLAARRRITS